MICPKCAHPTTDGLAYCEHCGNYLATAASQPTMRVVSTSTYRLDLYDQPGGGAPMPSANQATASFYNVYEPAAQQPLPAAALGTPFNPMPASGTSRKQQRRARRTRALFSTCILSMLLLGFGGGMTAFAADEVDNRMPLVVEYEEMVDPTAATALPEPTDTDVVTILDDPVPMASSPTADDSLADYVVAATPAPEPTDVPAPIAGALEQAPAEPVVQPLAPCTLEVNGTRVPYIHSVFASACPDNNAALWAGSDDTTDGSFGYFIGHNPGDFACVYALVPGNYVTLCDANGNLRNYTVAQLYDVPNTIFFHEVVERLIPQGESLIMQTCIGDGSYYRIVVCQ